ncbi:MAG: hypothetical protein F6J93_01855 [Oscillatoria sp. SIO1A7]|nr:hypothetical protein [Oscillatoria sp. SIO1A7]
MKIGNFLRTAAVVLGTILSLSPPSNSQQRAPRTFFCGSYNGQPATMINNPSRGNAAFIVWGSDNFSSSGLTPQKRCREVSQRFQRYQEQGLLNYIIPETINGYPVLCASRSANGSCDGVLFVLRPGDDPQAVVEHIVNINLRITAAPIHE